jgi:hypothetical protein
MLSQGGHPDAVFYGLVRQCEVDEVLTRVGDLNRESANDSLGR